MTGVQTCALPIYKVEEGVFPALFYCIDYLYLMVAESPFLTECSDDDGQQRPATLPDSDSFLYFAYGSNLLEERIHVQVKGAVFLSIGLLPSYELCFFDQSRRWQGALASVEEKVGSHVWGCVWQVPNSFAAELDMQEAGYHRLQVDITLPPSSPSVLGQKVLRCRTYQYSYQNRALAPPSPHYKHVILLGAIEHQLPSDYVEQLREIPTNGYKGSVELNLNAIKHLNENAPIEPSGKKTEDGGCVGA